MRLIFPIILLVFVFTEISLLITLGQHYGWWLIFYLVVMSYLGLQLIRGEKQTMSAKMMQQFRSGGNPVKSIMGSARNMFAGVLLLIPGVITDVFAAVLLLIPIKQAKVDASNSSYHTDESTFEGRYQRKETPANDDIIEGEYEEIVDPKDSITNDQDKI